MKIGVNKFVERQTKDSNFSYFDGSWEDLIELTESYFTHQKEGYRDGVILIPVPPLNFYSSVLEMDDTIDIEVNFEARADGEDPFLFVTAQGAEKAPAKRVEIILYRHDVLDEDGDCSTDAEWEIVCINASPSEKEIPMDPMTRARNILHLAGGTDAKIEDLTKDELIELVKNMAEEIVFWQTHVRTGG